MKNSILHCCCSFVALGVVVGISSVTFGAWQSIGPGSTVKSRRTGQPIAYRSAADKSATLESALTADRHPAIPHSVANAFGISDGGDQIEFRTTTIDRLGFRHDTYQQVRNGVEVFTGILKVHYGRDGSLQGAAGRFYQLPEQFQTRPRLTTLDVERIVADEYGDDVRLVDHPLVIVDPGWYGDPSIGPLLAFQVTIARDHPLEEIAAFVDAESGQILDEWSLLCTAQDRAVYDGSGQSTLPGALARAEGQAATSIADVDAMYDYSGDSYDFFLNAFGRDGVDNNGGVAIATVRVDDIGAIPCPNAAYSFIRKQVLICDGAAADDVIAHEWVHGLTLSTASLFYQNQSGQLNESFSDVFGELIDQYNGGSEIAGLADGTPWTIHATGGGSDTPNAGRSSGCYPATGLRWLFGEDAPSMNGPFRDLWNPNCFLHPATATDPFQSCPLIDNGGVHSGSGVTNHAFAMLCDGKSFNGFNVPAIGPAKTAAVWYRALTAYLTAGSDFQDAFIAFNLAADDLVGTTPNDPRTGMPGASVFSQADADAVNTALLAVELNAPGVCGEAMPPLSPELPLTCETEEVVFEADFEAGLSGWTLTNSAPPTPYDWIITSGLPFGRVGSALFIESRNIGDCADHLEPATHDAITPSIQTPVDFETLTVIFDHFLELEPRFDGGLIEIDINGNGFQPIPRPAFRANGYNTSLFTAAEQGSTNPLEGRTVFSGVGGGWGTSVIELGSLVAPGDSIRLRFRFGKDNCFGFDGRGWWIDDLRVVSCRSSGDCNRNAIADEIDRAAGPAAELLLDQPINLRAISNYSDADPHPTLGVNKIAEDFQLLRNASITAVGVRGGYSDDVALPDDFTVAIYESAGGIPGSLLHEFVSVPSVRIVTGEIFHLSEEYAYELTLPQPVFLSAGDYFISVFNNTATGAGTWRWGRAWFGWKPGAAFLAPGCPDWCRVATANFAIEIFGDTIGRDLGDLNGDGARDLADITSFVESLLSGAPSLDASCAADMNADGAIDGRDIEPFGNCIISSDCPN